MMPEKDRVSGSVCWVLSDIGNYHDARISALAAVSNNPVHVVEIGNVSGFSEFKAQKADSQSYHIHTLFPGMNHEEISTGQMVAGIPALLDKIEPAVVCVHGWSLRFSLVALDWAMARGVPRMLVSESQETDVTRYMLKESVKRMVISHFSSGLVGGKPHAEYLHALGMPADRIFKGYDVVDNTYFTAGAEKARADPEAVRNKLNLPERYFLASCRLVRRKNVDTIIRAYALYRKEAGTSGCSLVILGDGEMRKDLEALCVELGVEGDVKMPGFQSYGELPAYYALAEAFIHASSSEQWGLVVNEAMASGTPVFVSNRCGCAPDLVIDGKNGFVFDPADVNGLARLLTASTRTGYDLGQMGKAGKEIIAQWSPETFARNFRLAEEKARSLPLPASGFVGRMLIRSILTVK